MSSRKTNSSSRFRPYRSSWNESRSSRKKKSFTVYIFWILALVILIVLIFYGLTTLQS